MASYQAELLKEEGNAHFRNQDWEKAIHMYSVAIQKNSNNSVLFTNRANARLKISAWEDVIDDCLRAIGLVQDNMKAYYYLGQAQLALNHPNEALSSAIRAYELCSRSVTQTSSAFSISNFVVKCKRAKWDLREKERLRRKKELLPELEDMILQRRDEEIALINSQVRLGEIGLVAGQEDIAAARSDADSKVGELRTAFAISDPINLAKRVGLRD
jgi:STIP1 family protein 1